jgi:NADH dehydrogenase FAD-containing subunit
MNTGTQVNSKSFERFVASEGKLSAQRRIDVGPHLQIGQHNNIFAIGDASSGEAMLVSSALAQVLPSSCTP